MNRTALLMTSLVLLAAACDRSTPAPAAPIQPTPATEPTRATVVALPTGLVVRAELPQASGLGEVMREAKVGDRVVFAARIAGRADPFVNGRAMMVVSDPKLLPCNEREDDQCATPADLCCETRETLRTNTATVQVVDAQGRAIPLGLAGVEGLAALDHVVIEGVLTERGDEGGFVVNATRVVRRAT